MQRGGERMAALADQRAAAAHRPLRRVRGVRAAVALLGLDEQHLVARRAQDLRRLGHGRRIDPVLGVAEQFAARADGGAGGVHLRQHALAHHQLRHLRADRLSVTRLAEIAGERLLADHVLARAHTADDHLRVHRGRGADIDDVDVRVVQQRAPVVQGRAECRNAARTAPPRRRATPPHAPRPRRRTRGERRACADRRRSRCR